MRWKLLMDEVETLNLRKRVRFPTDAPNGSEALVDEPETFNLQKRDRYPTDPPNAVDGTTRGNKPYGRKERLPLWEIT